MLLRNGTSPFVDLALLLITGRVVDRARFMKVVVVYTGDPKDVVCTLYVLPAGIEFALDHGHGYNSFVDSGGGPGADGIRQCGQATTQRWGTTAADHTRDDNEHFARKLSLRSQYSQHPWRSLSSIQRQIIR